MSKTADSGETQGLLGRRGAREAAAALGLLAALLACKHGQKEARQTTVDAAVAPSASAPSLPALPLRDIPAGDVTSGGPWLGGFKAGRSDHDAGLTWSAARAACRIRDLDLCTEPEWRRGCGLDPEIGKVSSWTSTGKDATGFVVRGGSGCDSAVSVPGSKSDPARIGLCCSRAIAIQTTNRHPAFLRTVSEKLMSFERAVTAHNIAKVEALLDDPVTLYSLKNVPKHVAKGKFEAEFRQHPQDTTLHGTCEVTLELVGDVARDKWIAECDKVVDRGSELAIVIGRYEFGGPETKLRLIKEPRIIRNWSAP
jgi:hypothetical protein